jgi:hypothetical protein
LWPASTTARSPEAVLITVASTKSACSNGLALRAPSATFLGVVGVHEDIGARLQLVPDAAGAFEFERPRSRATDGAAMKARLVEKRRVSVVAFAALAMAARRSSGVRRCWAEP